MECYITTIALKDSTGMVATFVSVSAADSPDVAVAEAHQQAIEQHPGWIPLKGTANVLTRDALRDIAHKVLGL